MIILRRYASPLEARQAAAYLRAGGVAAEVVGDLIQGTFGLPNMRFAQAQLVIQDKTLEREAERLLEEFDARPRADVAALEADATPDLSRFDFAKHPLACPTCKAALRPRHVMMHCPDCGAELDALALIIEKHGPEALADCYDAPAISEDVGRAFACRGCGYNLAGLSRRGRCPECGALYEKD